jgi:hypothetical protein
MTAPRLYAMVATGAPVALVFRRGPSRWWHLARWNLTSGALEPGAWFHGTLYPRRSDLSPDGKLLTYLALKGGPRAFLGGTYSAVSKAPWLFALAAWRECIGTYSRGAHFTTPSRRALTDVEVGSLRPLRQRRLGLALTGTEQYAAERRRGWVEHETCPPRAASDTWDEKRSVILVKPRPRGDQRLLLTDRGWNPSRAIQGRHPRYDIEGGPALRDAVWADWDPKGRLLVATNRGTLEIRTLRALEPVVVHDLANLPRTPTEAPAWARRW